MNDELPEGWAAATVADVAAGMKNGLYKPADSYAVDGVACLRMYNIAGGKIVWKDIKRMKLSADEVVEYGLVPGDLLVNRVNSRELVGKTALIPEGIEPCVFESKNIRLRVKSGAVHPALVNFALLLGGQAYFSQNTQQVVGMASISQPQVSRFPLRLPPRAEQERMVAKVEALLAKVRSSQDRLVKIPTIIKRFRQSVLAAACSGKLTSDWRDEHPHVESGAHVVARLTAAHELAGGHKRGNAAAPTEGVHDLTKEELPDSWDVTEMRNVVDPARPITYGILKPGPNIACGVLYVRVADYPNDTLNLSCIKRTTKEIDQAYVRARLKAGDILLAIRGTVGRIVVVPASLTGANITQDTARLAIQDDMHAAYVAWYLRSPAAQKRMQGAVKGVAIRGINIGDVRALQVAVPPMEEQTEIVRRVEAMMALADRLQSRYEKAKAHVDRLTQSVLAKAFRGELVPTEAELARREGREYETAEELLARIKIAPVTPRGTPSGKRAMGNSKRLTGTKAQS